jgi:hypothetical protein
MWGFMYRRAVGLKELGERLSWNGLINAGLSIREWVLEHGKIA